MKKIIKPYKREEAKYYCDKHKKRECFNEIKTSSWYGSKHDLTKIEMHLCDECLQELYDYIKNNFGVIPHDEIF